MADSRAELYRVLAAARRAQGVTQSALAKQVGCKQSAISMMERGRSNALAWSTLQAIGQALEVGVEAFASETEADANVPPPGRGYCPTFDCPANTPYIVNGTLYAMPRPHAVAGGGDHCRYCGELQETQCPGCGTNVGEGACCCACGTPYVPTPQPHEGSGGDGQPRDDALPDVQAWVNAQHARLSALGLM